MNDNKETETKPCTIQNVVLSVFESYSDSKLEEEKRLLEVEISAADDRLRSVENEIFYRKNTG